MNEMTILFTVGPFTVTAFGLCVVAGAVLALALAAVMGRKDPGLNGVLSLGAATLLGAVLGARILYCLTMLEFILIDLGGAGFIPQLWQGGYTLYGAILGGGAGAWLYAKATGRKAGRVLDLAAVGGAVALAFERAGEYFTTQGLGEYIMDETWCRFPFAVESVYGDWQIPVFMYEALAAAVIAVVLVCMVNRKPAGRSAEAFIILLGVTQIILESLREDEFIRFGFVRLNMLAAAITMGLTFFGRVYRMVKANGWKSWQIIRLVIFTLGIVLVILIEFALDKSTIDNTLLYFIMAGMLAVMGFAMLYDGRKKA